MYDYETLPSSYQTYTTDDPDWGIKNVREQLNWALNLPSDPDFAKLCTFVENTHSADGVIRQIREKFMNADDLAKISMAIEAMREELIEVSAAKFEQRTHI